MTRDLLNCVDLVADAGANVLWPNLVGLFVACSLGASQIGEAQTPTIPRAQKSAEKPTSPPNAGA